MTIFAICMTALSAFLLGLMCGKEGVKKEKTSIKKGRQFKEMADKKIISEEYLNFLNYDGTEQR